MNYQFRMRGPVTPTTKGSPYGERQYWEMTEGNLTGEGINAKIAMPGGDWTLLSTDGFSRADVRVQFVTDDNELILLKYFGLIEVNEVFRKAAAENKSTDFEDHYMRMIMHFDTGSEKYQWLNKSFFIAEGQLIGTHEIHYKIYQLL